MNTDAVLTAAEAARCQAMSEAGEFREGQRDGALEKFHAIIAREDSALAALTLAATVIAAEELRSEALGCRPREWSEILQRAGILTRANVAAARAALKGATH